MYIENHVWSIHVISVRDFFIFLSFLVAKSVIIYDLDNTKNISSRARFHTKIAVRPVGRFCIWININKMNSFRSRLRLENFDDKVVDVGGKDKRLNKLKSVEI